MMIRKLSAATQVSELPVEASRRDVAIRGRWSADHCVGRSAKTASLSSEMQWNFPAGRGVSLLSGSEELPDAYRQ
jgi:hypothetical protein